MNKIIPGCFTGTRIQTCYAAECLFHPELSLAKNVHAASCVIPGNIPDVTIALTLTIARLKN